MSHAAIVAKCEAGEMIEALRLSQRVIELAAGDATRGESLAGSPLAVASAMCSFVKCCLGMPGWRQQADEAMTLARGSEAVTAVTVTMYKYVPVVFGAISIDDEALRGTAEAVRIAEQSGNDFTLGFARFTRGLAMIHHGGTDREAGFALLADVRESVAQERLSMTVLPAIDTYLARAKAHDGALDAAIELSRNVVDGVYMHGGLLYLGVAVEALGELLLRRGETDDLAEAGAAIERLAAVPTDPGFVLHELPLLRLRALLAVPATTSPALPNTGKTMPLWLIRWASKAPGTGSGNVLMMPGSQPSNASPSNRSRVMNSATGRRRSLVSCRVGLPNGTIATTACVSGIPSSSRTWLSAAMAIVVKVPP